MAGDPRVARERRELRRQVLLAQCELDRQELRHEFGAIRSRFRDGSESVRRSFPWLLALAPVAGWLVVRTFRRGRWSRLATVARWAVEWRFLWPVVRPFFRARS